MGKSCDCCDTECCLCDRAWNIINWSVYVLGQNFNGEFLPSQKPDPFTRQNSCNSRIGDCCIVEPPVLIDDCRQESDWFGLAAEPCCPQCICSGTHPDPVPPTGQLVYGHCEAYGLLNYEFGYKGVTHTRAWQQESYYATAQMYQCCDINTKTKTRFIFDLYYYVVRFSSESNQGYTRYRTVSYDCLYEPPNQQATGPDNVTRGEWVQPVGVGIFPPCMPYSWPQSTFFGNCETLIGTECPPCEEIIDYSERTGGAVSLRSRSLIHGCNVIHAPWFLGFSGHTCLITDPSYFRIGMRTINVFSSSGDEFCTDITIGPNAKVVTFTHRFISECYECRDIPSQVRLDRVTGNPTNATITQYIFDGLYNPKFITPCGPLPGMEKIIPPYITMNLTSGTLPQDDNNNDQDGGLILI